MPIDCGRPRVCALNPRWSGELGTFRTLETMRSRISGVEVTEDLSMMGEGNLERWQFEFKLKLDFDSNRNKEKLVSCDRRASTSNFAKISRNSNDGQTHYSVAHILSRGNGFDVRMSEKNPNRTLGISLKAFCDL